MALTGEPSRVCTRTGLVVVEQPNVALWRVFKASDGPLSPPIRSGSPDERWSRFDVPGVATIYGATHSRGAFVETLASLSPAKVRYAELFDDLGPSEDPVTQDWAAMQHMRQGNLAAQWRRSRQLSELLLRRGGQYIDVMAGDTISALRNNVSQWATSKDPRLSRIDTSMLTGSDRRVTCSIAKWLREQVLDNGSSPTGIRYVSRHGGELPCWAVWVDLQGASSEEDVKALVAQHVEEISRASIEEADRDFQWAAKSLGLMTR